MVSDHIVQPKSNNCKWAYYGTYALRRWLPPMQLLMSLLERFDILLQAISLSILQVVLPILCATPAMRPASWASLTCANSFIAIQSGWSCFCLPLLLEFLPTWKPAWLLLSLHWHVHFQDCQLDLPAMSACIPWLLEPARSNNTQDGFVQGWQPIFSLFFGMSFLGSNAAHLNQTAVPRLQAMMQTEILQNRFYIFEECRQLHEATKSYLSKGLYACSCSSKCGHIVKTPTAIACSHRSSPSTLQTTMPNKVTRFL